MESALIVLPALIIAFFAVTAATPVSMRLAERFGAVAKPDGQRRLHAKPTPELGGLAVIAAVILTGIAAVFAGWLPDELIIGKHLIGLLIAAIILAFGGAIDDLRRLRPWQSLLVTLAAVAAVIISGIGINLITNPFGGVLHLNDWSYTVLWFQGIPYRFTVVADIFTLVWLFGMTYTTKLLDGLDGLVAGVTAIGGFTLALVSLTRDVPQPGTAFIAAAVAGAFLGFLVYNANPAKTFLGESGATFAGFSLGVLAIVSGGKIATALLVLGLPIFDLAFVIYRRWRQGRPLSQGGRDHLHQRLNDAGLSVRQVATIYYAIAATFGLSTLVLPDWAQVLALVVVLLVLVGLVHWSNRAIKK